MMKLAIVLCGVALAAPALAQQAPAAAKAPPAAAAPAAAPAGGMDMSKMGPMTRKVTKEDKKGIADFYKAMEDAWKKGDVNAVADMVDFPVIMMSDNSKGEEKHFEASREQWIATFKPVMENMPKNMKMTMKQTPTFLSDTLAVVIETTTVTAPMKGSWKSFSVLNNKDGKWKVKQMAEAGWGDMAPPGGAPAGKKPPAGK